MKPAFNNITYLLLGYFFIFFGGMIVANNLTILYGYNASYEGSWFKIIIAILLSIAGVYMIRRSD